MALVLLIDLFMGLVRGAVFRHGGGALKLAGVLRGNTIRGNTTRNSERKVAL